MEIEKHVWYVLGYPVSEKRIYNVESQQNSYTANAGNAESKIAVFHKTIWFIIVSILAVFFYFAVRYVAIQNCPNKLALEQVQTDLSQCQAKFNEADVALRSTQSQTKKLITQNSEITAQKLELESKFKKAESEVSSVKGELASAKKQVGEFHEENNVLKEQKESISKDLSATKYTLGTCKNKNMDHEVRSLELLQEIESLKKELKAC